MLPKRCQNAIKSKKINVILILIEIEYYKHLIAKKK